MESTLIEEKQITMLDTELSVAVDELVALKRNQRILKEKLEESELKVLSEMVKERMEHLRFDGGFIFLKQGDIKVKVEFDKEGIDA